MGIQQMFADKVKEYAKKKAAAGGKLPSPWSSRRLPRPTEAEPASTCQSSLTSNSSTLRWTTFHSSKQVIKSVDTKTQNHQIHNYYYTVNIHSFLKFSVIVVSVF